MASQSVSPDDRALLLANIVGDEALPGKRLSRANQSSRIHGNFMCCACVNEP
jgi:hypothetical protein